MKKNPSSKATMPVSATSVGLYAYGGARTKDGVKPKMTGNAKLTKGQPYRHPDNSGKCK